MPYTDETLLTFGKHKFTKLCRVPADYLLNIYLHGTHDKDLMFYIQTNIEKIRARNEGKIKAPELELGVKMTGRFVNIVCKDTNKIIYPTEKDAKKELNRIKDSDSKKKPIRTYECNKCGGWHLTSKEYNPIK